MLVYIHGGGFTGGCGHEKHFGGPVWPTKGVIGVTLNYRLGEGKTRMGAPGKLKLLWTMLTNKAVGE